MTDKNKEELIEEIKLLQRRIAELEAMDSERKQQQQQQDIRRLATVVRDSNDAITIQDFDGWITAWNRGAELMYGYNEKDALGMNIRHLTPPDKMAEQKEFTRRLIAGEGVTSFETQRVAKDGRILDVWLTVTKLVDDTGKPIGIASTERNITERKKEEKALRENESRLCTVLETVKEGIIFSDEKGCFEVYNSEMERLTGYSKEEADRSGDFMALLYPDAKENRRAQERLGVLLKENRGQEFESVIQRKDGQPKHVLIYSVIVPYQNRRMFLSTFRDITERKKQEEQIRHAAGEWRMTFDSITDLVSIIDREFRLVRVNKAFAHAFGMHPKEVVGKTCYELVREAGESWFSYPHKKTAETKKPNTVEFFEPHLKIYLEVSTSPIFDDKGEVIATVHTAKDITQRKEIEKYQRLSQLGKLVADMAHEVNNPLMIISGNAQLSLMEGTKEEEIKNNLRVIFEESHRAKDIIQRLLRFSRPSKGETKEVDINNSIEKIVAMVKHQFMLVNVEIKRNYLENPPLIAIDEQQMQEVFMNLVNNAKEAMPNGGTITITTSLEEDFLRIDFKDTGCGMSEEVKKKLVEPFFTTKEKGTGLGLAVCYGIVKAYNGELKFESELNKGATATVLLPLRG